MQLQRRFGMPVLVILVLVVWYASNRNADIPQSPATGDGVVEQAHAERRSGVWVEVDGRVARLLADDNEGSRWWPTISILPNACRCGRTLDSGFAGATNGTSAVA
jgi:hypothetical protein